jgi:hypothetical protein
LIVLDSFAVFMIYLLLQARQICLFYVRENVY